MAVELFIARHGQDEDNAQGILNGRRNLPLTELGRHQAEELAKGILQSGLEFKTIYSSPLARALETARIISRKLQHKTEPIVLPELIERDFGVMTGVPIKEIERLCAPNILKSKTITYFLNPKDAETFPELIQRGKKAISHIYGMQSDGNALLVCHGDIGKMIYAAATEKPWEDVLNNFHFGNGDLIEIGLGHKTHKIKLLQHNL